MQMILTRPEDQGWAKDQQNMDFIYSVALIPWASFTISGRLDFRFRKNDNR